MLRWLCRSVFPLFCRYTFTVRFDVDGRMHAAPVCCKCGKTGHFQAYHRVKKGYEGAATAALVEMLMRGEEP
jgi:hypothetical protein